MVRDNLVLGEDNIRDYLNSARLTKLAVSAAKPATNAPIRAVASINKKGLSVLKNNKDMRCAKMLLLLELIQKLSIPHSKNKAINPVKNDAIGV
jgi:hypothetical protein